MPTQRLGGTAGLVFDVQPQIRILDGFTEEQRIASMGHLMIAVRIFNNPGCGILAGSSVAPLVGDMATFTDLSIRGSGTGFVLRYCVEPCRDNEWLITDDILSTEFSMRFGILQIMDQPCSNGACRSMSSFPASAQPAIRVLVVKEDRLGNQYQVTDRDYNFGITASFNQAGVELQGRRTVWPVNGKAYFTDLRLDVSGYKERGANFRLVFTSCYGEPDCLADGGKIDDQMVSVVSEKFDVAHGRAETVLIVQQPSWGYTGLVLGATCIQYKGPVCLNTALVRPPTIQVADVAGNVVLTGDWYACARLQRENSTDLNEYMHTLRGDAQVKTVDGVAVFTNLDISLAEGGYFLNFSVYEGSASAAGRCQALTGSEFAMAVSTSFVVDFTYASKLLPKISPMSEIGPDGYRKEGGLKPPLGHRGEVLIRQPSVAFSDPDNNTLTLADCPAEDADECNMNIGVRVATISDEDSTSPKMKIYASCSDLATGFVCQPYDLLQGVPKKGIVTFTDMALLRVGTYVLQYFSGTLTADTEPFYVGSDRAAKVYRHVSPRLLGGLLACVRASRGCFLAKIFLLMPDYFLPSMHAV